ncbi:F-box/kelch-repeat protein At3g23880-like [Cornus florida]|uniref:F-box/kelch-repeat protein At3g23880-like n=1 Tax=Cornus florida TaxID=4283 RepID=UPI0028A029FD|nr:F-box/kelch-repeat protein At3g23880-like [Cornus florida]
MWAVYLERARALEVHACLFVFLSSIVVVWFIELFCLSWFRSCTLPRNVENGIPKTQTHPDGEKGKKRKNKRRKRRRKFYLPDDVVIGILSRLPVKSLMKFRCVCKSWHAFVTNPNFISMHLNNYTRSSTSTTTSDGFAQLVFGPLQSNTREPIFSLVSFNKLKLDTAVSVVKFDLSPFINGYHFGDPALHGSCDGIVCLYGLKPGSIALWNPAIRQFKILPVSHIPLPPNSRVVNASVGLGFDSTSNDYKVVQVFRCHINYDPTFQVEIYSLKTDCWRKLDVIVPAKITHNCWSLACTNNRIICWWAVVKDFGGVILSFDVSNEVFLTTPVPSFPGAFVGKDKATRAIVAFDESFALVAFTPSHDQVHDIWVLKEFGVQETWTKLLSIDSISEPYKPIGLWKNGRFLLYDSSEQLAFYNRVLKKLNILEFEEEHPYWMLLFTRKA